MDEKRAGENTEAHYVGTARREPRAVTNELLDRAEAGGFRPALLAFMNGSGEVQVATLNDIEVRQFIEYLHDEWLSRLDENRDRRPGS